MKRSILIGLMTSLIINQNLYAEIPKGILQKYKKSSVLICIGVYSCTNLACALDSGYADIYAIDSDKIMIDHAKIVFPRYTNPENANLRKSLFLHGDHTNFQALMSTIDKPVTVILGNCFPDADGSPANNIMDYLDVIKRHRIFSHAILIDYISYAGTPRFGNISFEAILNKLRDINPYYDFYFEKGGILANEDRAILVAYTWH